MKRETLLDIVGIIGLFLVPGGFVGWIEPYIRYPALIAGFIAIGFYVKFHYDNKFEQSNRENKKIKEEIK